MVTNIHISSDSGSIGSGGGSIGGGGGGGIITMIGYNNFKN